MVSAIVTAQCPVLPLAREARRLVDAYHAGDKAGGEPDLAIPPRLFAIEAQAAPLTARSREGQLYLALIAHGAGEQLASIAQGEPDAGYFTRLFRSASVSAIGGLARVDYQALINYYSRMRF